ncbi:MAG: hypothetical protein IJS62_08095 [Bacteroidales bacterium]|nr:hypothetical protein [Bacteroidales bacterium]
MKALFITYNQAYNEEVVELLDKHGQRGFTRWVDVQGRGGVDGTPHMGNHAWPEMNHALLTMVEDEMAAVLLAGLKAMDEASPNLGLRAFAWQITDCV